MAEHQHGLEEDSIDLAELFLLFWREKILIISAALVVAVLATILAFSLTPKYTVTVLLQPVSQDGSDNGTSGLARQFGGLASLAGVSIGGESSQRSVSIATLKSRYLITKFIEEENLLPVLFEENWDAVAEAWDLKANEAPPSLWQGHQYFVDEVMSLNDDIDTGLLVVSITWRDADVAVQWSTALIDRANKYLQEVARQEADNKIEFLQDQIRSVSVVEIRQSLSQMMTIEMQRKMMAYVSDAFAFRVLDPASPPDLNDFSFPNRPVLIIIGLLIGTITGALLSILKDQRPASMAWLSFRRSS